LTPAWITQILKDDPVWHLCCEEWGLGTGFKERVIDLLAGLPR